MGEATKIGKKLDAAASWLTSPKRVWLVIISAAVLVLLIGGLLY